MYLGVVVFFQLFSLISGPGFYFNEFLRSAVLGQPFNFQCARSEKNFPIFMFFSRNHPHKYQVLVPKDERALQLSDFDPRRSTKVIIHGFLDSVHMSDWMQRMTAKILEVEDSNVIVVDWSCGNLFPYARAIDNSKIVSKNLEDLILFLQEKVSADPSTFHLIGHSMGCHIGARVGYAIPNIGRITALDPALPRYYLMPIEDRLDPSDAKFVDVIHSNAGYSVFEGLGIRTRVGHLDFYPNGGNNQPGCKQPPFTILPRIGLFNGVRYYVSCDHYRAVEFYIESIQPVALLNSSTDTKCHPIAVACRDWNAFSQGRCADCSLGDCAFMGYNSDVFSDIEISNREYFVQTFDEEPFCTFQYQVTVETDSEQNSTNDSVNLGISDVNRGIIRLELEGHDGRMTRLDDKNAKELRPNVDYVYLATSRSYIEVIQRANFWFDSIMNSNIPMTTRSRLTNLKRIKILPIELPMLVYSAASSREIVMCGSYDKAIEGNKKINLTINDC